MKVTGKSQVLKIILTFVICITLVTVAGCSSSDGSGSSTEEYMLNMNIVGEGETTPEEGEYTYKDNEKVELKAEETGDHLFYRWKGATAEKYVPDTSVWMTDDREVTAVFDQFDTGSYTYDLSYDDYQGITLPDYGKEDDAFVLLYSTEDKMENYNKGKLLTDIDDGAQSATESNPEATTPDEKIESRMNGIGMRRDIPVLRDKEKEILKDADLSGPVEGDRDSQFSSKTDYSPENEQDFWVFINQDQDQDEKTAELKAKNEEEGVYLWATKEAEKHLEDGDIEGIRDDFLDFRDRLNSLFGEEPELPDKDDYAPGFHILFTDFKDYPANGYFFGADLLTDDDIDEDLQTNARKIVYINADILEASLDYTRGVIAHEYQHLLFCNEQLIQRNGPYETWINEGFSELAKDIAGYGFEQDIYSEVEYNNPVESYLDCPPDTSLINWRGDPKNYGMSYLFARYLYDLYEEEEDILREISTSSREAHQEIEESTGKEFEKVFADWAETVMRDTLADVDNDSGAYDDIDLEEDSLAITELNPGENIEETDQVVSWGVDFSRISSYEDGTGDLDIMVQDPADSGEFMKTVIRIQEGEGE
ncbi:MAG: hypothetical protein ACOCZM_00345 [Bacillota bacterium]